MLIPGQQRVYAGFCVGSELCNSTLPFVVRFVYERSFFITNSIPIKSAPQADFCQFMGFQEFHFSLSFYGQILTTHLFNFAVFDHSLYFVFGTIVSAFPSLFSIRADFHIAPLDEQSLYLIKQILFYNPFVVTNYFKPLSLICTLSTQCRHI